MSLLINPYAFGTTGGGGFTDPTDLANLEIWIYADDLSSTHSDGDQVSGDGPDHWYDRSGNGYVFELGTGSTLEPIYRTNIQNSLPGVQFDGSNDVLAESTLTKALKPAHGFAVIQCDNFSDQNTIIDFRSGGFSWRIDTDGKPDLVKSETAVIGTGTTALSSGTTHLIEVSYDGSGNYTFTLDGSSDGSGTNDQTLSADRPYLGRRGSTSQDYFDGYIFELVLYNAVLSSGDAADVRTYLNDKWAVY